MSPERNGWGWWETTKAFWLYGVLMVFKWLLHGLLLIFWWSTECLKWAFGRKMLGILLGIPGFRKRLCLGVWVYWPSLLWAQTTISRYWSYVTPYAPSYRKLFPITLEYRGLFHDDFVHNIRILYRMPNEYPSYDTLHESDIFTCIWSIFAVHDGQYVHSSTNTSSIWKTKCQASSSIQWLRSFKVGDSVHLGQVATVVDQYLGTGIGSKTGGFW